MKKTKAFLLLIIIIAVLLLGVAYAAISNVVFNVEKVV